VVLAPLISPNGIWKPSVFKGYQMPFLVKRLLLTGPHRPENFLLIYRTDQGIWKIMDNYSGEWVY
jgi:hypothetical protein